MTQTSGPLPNSVPPSIFSRTHVEPADKPLKKVYADIPRMLLWLRDNGHKNDNAGRAAYSTTLQAIHPDVDYVPKQQTYAAANFGGIFGPMGLGVDQRGRHYTPTVDFEAMPRMNRWR
jgi:hypothetical protein